VIGSFLDLDNGFCSYYINGCDLGLTVEFEHPNRQKSHHKSKRTTSSQNSTTTSTTSSPRSSFSESITSTTTTGQSIAMTESPIISSSSPQMDKQQKKKKPAKGLGLYPAISLTTHQQALVNFGERPWMYPPPTTARYRGLNEAGALDNEFEKRVMRWVKKRGITSHGKSYQPMNKPPLRPRVGADEIVKNGGSSPQSSQDSTTDSDRDEQEEEEEDYDWDGPLCTICFSEPKNTMLMPCKHAGIGGRCAKALTLW
jgi:hypothetical protein